VHAGTGFGEPVLKEPRPFSQDFSGGWRKYEASELSFPCWVNILSFLWHWWLDDRKDIRTCATCRQWFSSGTVGRKTERNQITKVYLFQRHLSSSRICRGPCDAEVSQVRRTRWTPNERKALRSTQLPCCRPICLEQSTATSPNDDISREQFARDLKTVLFARAYSS